MCHEEKQCWNTQWQLGNDRKRARGRLRDTDLNGLAACHNQDKSTDLILEWWLCELANHDHHADQWDKTCSETKLLVNCSWKFRQTLDELVFPHSCTSACWNTFLACRACIFGSASKIAVMFDDRSCVGSLTILISVSHEVKLSLTVFNTEGSWSLIFTYNYA